MLHQNPNVPCYQVAANWPELQRTRGRRLREQVAVMPIANYVISPEQLAVSELMLNLRRLKQARSLIVNAHRDNESNRVQVWDLELGLIADKLNTAIREYSRAARLAADKVKA